LETFETLLNLANATERVKSANAKIAEDELTLQESEGAGEGEKRDSFASVGPVYRTDSNSSAAGPTKSSQSVHSHPGGFRLGEAPPPLISRIASVGNMNSGVCGPGTQQKVMILDSQASFPDSLLVVATLDDTQNFPDAHIPSVPGLSPIALSSPCGGRER
jgi:hypothetical protein